MLESNPLGRRTIFRVAEKRLRQRAWDDMPAPAEALEAVRIGLAEGMAAGLVRERVAAGQLALTPACRHLIGLFFQREEARKLPESLRALHPPEVRRVGVVGAGVMGAGIAQLAAVKGCDVVVQEVSREALDAGLARIDGLFQKAQERGVLTETEADRRRSTLLGGSCCGVAGGPDQLRSGDRGSLIRRRRRASGAARPPAGRRPPRRAARLPRSRRRRRRDGHGRRAAQG